MSKLVICRGISGSGKTTWAREQNGVIVERDSLRAALFGTDDQAYYSVDSETLSRRENYITKVAHAAIKNALSAGNDVYVSDTNIQMKFVNAIAKIGYECDAEVEVKVFDVDVRTAKNRVASRGLAGGRVVPANIIERQAAKFKPGAKLPERPVVMEYTGTPGKPKSFMVDIDGTLADHTGKRGPYDLNVGVDAPRQKVIDTVNALSWSWFNYRVIVMSGRKEDCRKATIDWLEGNEVNFDELFMRASDDNRADNIVKHDLFWEHVADNYDVQFVLDDRRQVVEMWRKMGLDCFQVQEGDF